MRLVVAAFLLGAVVLAMAGGIDSPFEPETRMPAPRMAAPPPTRGGAATPTDAVEQLALAQGNWAVADVERAYERALTLTAGRARAEVRREAKAVAASVKSSRQRLRAHASVEAVVLGGVRDRREGLLVTRAGVRGSGVADEAYDYKVTLVVVERLEGAWTVTRWAPQP